MTQELEAIEREIRTHCDAAAYERAATVLLASYGRELFAFLVSRLRDADAASDAFSQFSEDLWRGLPGFSWRCSARAWAYTLARHAAARHAKVAGRERRRRVPLSQAGARSELEQGIRTETLAALKTEVKDRISQLRERLPAEDQTLLLLRVNRGFDWLEIAHVTQADSDEASDQAALVREAARLRKRFQLVKARLRKLAEADGLL